MALKNFPKRLDLQVAVLISTTLLIFLSVFSFISYQYKTEDFEQSLLQYFIFNASFAVLTALGVALVTLRFLKKPIQYIKDAANFAEFLDNSKREVFPIYSGADELQALGKALNLASNRLANIETETMAAIESLETQKFAMDQHSIVSITNTQGEIIYANYKLCEISEYTQQELLGRTHALLKSGLHDDEFFADLWHTISQGKVWQGEICNRTKSGKKFWALTTIVPFLDSNDLPFQYVAIRNDITAMKLATQELYESEQRLQQSQNFARIGSWELRLKTNQVFLSDSALKLLGNPDLPNTSRTDKYLSFVHLDDREKVTTAIKNCIKTGEMYQVEYRVLWPDNTTHWLQDSGNVLYDRHGEPGKILGVSQDITDQHEIAEKMEVLARLPNENPNPVMRISYDMELLYCNPAGKELLDLWNIELGDLVPDEITRIARNNIYENQTSTMDIKAGKRYYSVTLANVSKSRYLNLYMSDITMRKMAEEQVQNYQKHLEDLVDERTADLVKARDNALVAERSMSTFLTNMTHELRTPLHAILSFADFGMKKIDRVPKEKILEYFTKIHFSGNNLLELVNNLLDLSKLRAGKMSYNYSYLELSPIIQQVINELSVLAHKRGIEIRFTNNESTTAAFADKLRISQVIRNILSNAIKFSSENEMIEIAIKADETGATVTVRDRGIGIPENELESIFDSFSQSSITASSAGGTGLGLPICKEIIETGHEGWIKAMNAQPTGAIFSFFIPLKQNATINDKQVSNS